jgi:hypothetical protein
MPIDERRRLQLAEDAKRVLGDESGITLMEMLPPVGWADVATKRDLDALEHKLMSALHREMVTQTRWFVGAIVGAIAATAGTVAAFTT